jgi:hypothetical protein
MGVMERYAENSAPTTLVIGRPFRKGVSGNPGGRPKGLASYVREQTLEGEELADFYLAIFRGEKIDGKKPGLRHRMEAGTWLSDRGFGKAVQQSDIKVDHHKPDHRLSTYSLEQLNALLDALENRVPTLEIDGEARELDTPPE